MHQNPSSEAKNNVHSEDTGRVVEKPTRWMAKILQEYFIPCCYYYINISILFIRILRKEKLERGVLKLVASQLTLSGRICIRLI